MKLCSQPQSPWHLLFWHFINLLIQLYSAGDLTTGETCWQISWQFGDFISFVLLDIATKDKQAWYLWCKESSEFWAIWVTDRHAARSRTCKVQNQFTQINSYEKLQRLRFRNIGGRNCFKMNDEMKSTHAAFICLTVYKSFMRLVLPP